VTISIDYDGTYARNPELWNTLIDAAELAGVQVVCITRREDTEANRQEIENEFGDEFDKLRALIFAGPDTQKADAAKAAGIAVDIWIDDSPEKIPAADQTRAALARADQAVARMDRALRGATA